MLKISYLKTFVIVTLITTCYCSCDAQKKSDSWAPLKAFLMRDSSSFSDYQSKLLFTNCLIEKLKKKFPNGSDGLSQDVLNHWAQIYGSICSSELKGKLHLNLPWSSSVGKNFKKMLMRSEFVKDIPEDKKSDFCDCFLLKVKQRYPNGFKETMSIPFRDSSLTDCKNKLKINSN